MKILNTAIQHEPIVGITIPISPALALLFDNFSRAPHRCKFAVFRRKPRGQNEKGCR